MPMFTRLVRLWKADLHGVMDQLEDRELLLNQHLREMETALDAREAAVRRLERELESVAEARKRCETEIAPLETEIEAALDQERDDIARFLIRRRRELDQKRDALARRSGRLERDVREARERLAEQRDQYDSLRLRARDFRRTEDRPFDAGVGGYETEGGRPAEEEIELELLRRKKARSGKGGEA